MKELICIVCPKGCHLQVDEEKDYLVKGNGCPRGAEYGSSELRDPRRTWTTTVAIEGGAHDRLPVRTDRSIPKASLLPCMDLIHTLKVKSPVKAGDVIVEDILGTGANLIAARDL